MSTITPETGANILRHQLLEAHATPQVDLVSKQWIPIIDLTGNVRQVGVEDLLLHAHEIKDLAEPDPIVRAALRRFIQALAAQTVRLAGANHTRWLGQAENNSGFTECEVAALIADQRKHLWLYHPEFPFLQDIRLIEALTNPEALSVDELTAHLPGRNEAAWFVKFNDPLSGKGIEPAAAARGLVARWFYHLPGNSSSVLTPPDGTNGAQSGGAFSEGKATITHAFRVSQWSLATTLLRNLTADMVKKPANESYAGPAWSHKNRSAISHDALYLSTLTASSTLLTSMGVVGHIKLLVRGPIPQNKETVRQAREGALQVDPHRIIIQSTKKNRKLDTRVIRKSPSTHPLCILDSIHREALTTAQGHLRGIITDGDLWLTGANGRHDETIELFLADKQGNPASPKWSEVRTVNLLAAHMDPETSEFQFLIPILTECFDNKNGIMDKLKWAICDALNDNKPKDRSDATNRLVKIAQGRWLELAAAQIEYAAVNQAPTDKTNHALYANAREVFQEVLRPYGATTRYAASVVRAQKHIWEKRS
ncbi:type I-E CRISPR-associated protein Cse1/CasA [Acidithrix sp. C25]|uniref:type I-E CRISPR-associated protein Cse1/CasA n=1 Tax=Acidithrix sp. C25 TaxID=1671482 RepID=UPI00191B9D4F|nr:type I-E CRISPR-associated protein Cse1/CasA [Acidithrix sp. C25]